MNKLQKNLLISILSITLCFLTAVKVSAKTNDFDVSSIRFKENANLSSIEIQERFMRIDNSYEINEKFSESDAEFVTLYSVTGINNDSVSAAAASGTVRYISTTVCNVSVYFRATFSFGSASMFESWNVADDYVYLRSNISTINQLQFDFKVTYYGILGQGGVGIIGEGTDTATIIPSASDPTIYVTLDTYAWSFMSIGNNMYTKMKVSTNGCNETVQLNM